MKWPSWLTPSFIPSKSTPRIVEIEEAIKRARMIFGSEASNEGADGVSMNLHRLQTFAALWQSSAMERLAIAHGVGIPELKPDERAEFFEYFGNRFRRTGEVRQVEKGDWHCGHLESGPKCVVQDPQMEHVCEILEKIES